MSLMKKSHRQQLKVSGCVAAAAAFFLTAGAAFAQAPQAGAPTGGGAMGHDMKGMGGMGQMGGHEMKGMGGMEHGGMRGMMRHMLCGPTEHVEGRLAYLKAELKLTDQQQAAWSTFADAYRAAMQKTAQKCAAMDGAGADHAMQHGALGHLTMMERHMTDHLELVRGLKAAIEPLYGVLTDEQKKAADQAFESFMRMGMGGMGGMGMGHEGGQSGAHQ
jgi:hypothetical protein